MVKNKNQKSSKKTADRRIPKSVVTPIAQEPDAVYFLKLVLYMIIGSQWIRIMYGDMLIPLPVGLIIGIVFARMEGFQLDRKIEYAILLVSMFIGFWLPLGFEIVL